MQVERLGDVHDLTGFACGVDALDNWLRDHALENQRRDLSRTYVLINPPDVVVGYYALTMAGVRSDDLPRRLGRGLPNVDIGVVLLARLAIDRRRHGEGLGRDLLIDAIDRAAAAGAEVAARFVAVDPIDDGAARFYAKFGFKAIPGDARGRMFVRVDEAIQTLGSVRRGRAAADDG